MDRVVQWDSPESLACLVRISDRLDGDLGLQATLQEAIALLCTDLGSDRGMVTLIDRATGEIRIDAAHGLSSSEQSRGRYRIGEGVTGRVVATGEPVVIPRISEAGAFLDRTGARGAGAAELAFISVPIKTHGEVLGTLSIDRPADDPRPLDYDLGILTVAAAMIAYSVAARQAASELEARNQAASHDHDIIGRSKAMKQVFDAIEAVSMSDATVLIRGESGVGKELVADAIHRASARANKPFIKVNCAALPQTIIESELFGHERGAFTGAVEGRKGRFELAHGGTIFLDEIGDFSPNTQIMLLRVLQEKSFERVGGSQTLNTDVRVIAATNRDLESLIEQDRFRHDLYYRLNVFPIHVPALRERKTDVLLLADAFVERFARANKKDVRRITSQAIDMLMAYHWPGNVRELENCIERAVLLTDESVIHGHHLPPTLQTAEATGTVVRGTLPATLAAVEKDLLHDALKTARGNMAKAARSLGVSERQMGIRVRKYGIEPKKYRPR